MADFDTQLTQFMGGVRRLESGGNYATPPNRVGASGAYQFIDSTWGGYGGYQKAYQAPPEIQDQRARQLMTAYFQRFGNWNSVAQAWLGGPGSVGKHVSDGNITTDDYATRVLSYAGLGADGTTTAPVPQVASATTTAAPASQPAMTPAAADPHDLGNQLATFLGMLGTGSTSIMPASAGVM